MAYERAIYERVNTLFEQRRARALFEREKRLRQAYEACPSLRQIDLELRRCAVTATGMILSEPSQASDLVCQLSAQLSVLIRHRAEALRQGGFAADYTDVKYQCSVCGDTGYVSGRPCECMYQALAEEGCRSSNLSALFATQNFDTFDFSCYSDAPDRKEGESPRQRIEVIYRTCREFVDDFDNGASGLVLYGGTGLGKTFLSTAIAKELTANGKSVVYQSAVTLFSLYMNYTFGRIDASLALPQLNSLFTCDLLMIDDLGTEAVNGYTTAYLFELLNERILKGRRMVISTNLNGNEIAATYSERIHSRLLEHFTFLRFIGDDIRLKKMLDTNSRSE